jgi:hypothetical protein
VDLLPNPYYQADLFDQTGGKFKVGSRQGMLHRFIK